MLNPETILTRMGTSSACRRFANYADFTCAKSYPGKAK